MPEINAKEIILTLFTAFIGFLGSKLLNVSWTYWKILNRKAFQDEYSDYIKSLDDKDYLIVLFLEKISRCIAIISLNAVGVLIVFMPGNDLKNYEAKYFSAGVITIFMFCLIFISLSRPINVAYALKNPDKYKRIVEGKLGSLSGKDKR